MKKLFFLLFILTAARSFGQTQYELNMDARREYQSADSTLNSVYRQIIKEYSSEPVFIKNLKSAQQLWVKFRNAELKMKFPDGYSYGSVHPMCISFYLTELTTERIKTLRVWLDGIEEGDVCSGSVKIK